MFSLPAVKADSNAQFDALKSFARFYPINADKSPACRNLSTEPTCDPLQIRQWQRRGHAGFAARIAPGSKMFVLDLESPYKHRGTVGPDGMMSLCWRLDERDITLPDAPTVRTATGGYHLYLTAPASVLHSSVSLWPGVDILASGSNVILPGSQVTSGTYTALRGFHECVIPEAPASIIDLIANEQNALKRSRTDVDAILATMPVSGDAFVANRQWFLLWRNKVFRTMWNRRKMFGDTSNSAYEYHLAKSCFVTGLNAAQAVTVLRCWWKLYGLNNRMRKFQRGILPAAWREVAPYVRNYHDTTRVSLPLPEGRPLSTTTERVLAAIAEHPEWSPVEIASSLGVKANTVSAVLYRQRKRRE